MRKHVKRLGCLLILGAMLLLLTGCERADIMNCIAKMCTQLSSMVDESEIESQDSEQAKVFATKSADVATAAPKVTPEPTTVPTTAPTAKPTEAPTPTPKPTAVPTPIPEPTRAPAPPLEEDELPRVPA